MKRWMLVFLCLPLAAIAQNLILDENTVVKLALERNESIGIAEADLERAQLLVDATYSGLFPTLSAQLGIQKGKSTGSFVPNGNDWNESATVRLTQPLYSFGRLGSAIDIAEASLSLGQNQRIATHAQVKQTAQSLYYAVLYGQELVRITSESYRNAVKNKNTLEKRVAFGRISRNDNLKMQADLASRRPLLVDAERALQVAQLELANFLAIPETSSFEVVGSLATTSSLKTNIMDETALNSLAHIRILQDSLEIGKKSVDLAKADRLPILSAFGSFSPTTYRADFFGDKTRQQENLTVGVLLTFDWPFGGEKNDEVQLRKVEARVSQLRLQAGKRQSLTQYQSLLRQYESLQEKIKAELNAVKLAESSYQVALSAFSTGSVSQLQLNDSEILSTQNKISLASSRLELRNVVAQIERLLTTGNEEGVQ